MSSARTIRKFERQEAQKAETLRYWQSRTPGERLIAVWELSLAAWSAKGFCYDPSHRGDRTRTRIQRSRD